jgi:hypothetical protein
MTEFDLTQRITQFFDIHLALPLLDFLSTRNVCYQDLSMCIANTHTQKYLLTHMQLGTFASIDLQQTRSIEGRVRNVEFF